MAIVRILKAIFGGAGKSPVASARSTATSDEYVSEWETTSIAPGTFERPSGTVILKGLSAVRVAGTSFHGPAGWRYQSACRARKPNTTLILERDPSNPEDPNAIKVLSKIGRYPAEQIGHVEAPAAAMVAQTYPSAMPIFAEAVECGHKRDRSAIFVTIRILGPSAKDRKAFETT